MFKPYQGSAYVGILLSIGLEVTDSLGKEKRLSSPREGQADRYQSPRGTLEIAKNHERDELVLYLKELLAVLLQRTEHTKPLGSHLA